MNRVAMERSVLSANNRVAAELHDALDASKTARLEETLKLLPHSTRAAVLTGDIQTDNDAQRLLIENVGNLVFPPATTWARTPR